MKESESNEKSVKKNVPDQSLVDKSFLSHRSQRKVIGEDEEEEFDPTNTHSPVTNSLSPDAQNTADSKKHSDANTLSSNSSAQKSDLLNTFEKSNWKLSKTVTNYWKEIFENQNSKLSSLASNLTNLQQNVQVKKITLTPFLPFLSACLNLK
eukprot:Sdes_comp17930_c0_seq2m7187